MTITGGTLVADERPAPATPPRRHTPTTLRLRIVDAALVCLARHGTLKTTVDDVARQAGVSRATVYRAFPGGRDEVLGAVLDTEASRMFAAVGAKLAEASDLEDALVGGIVEASVRIRDHEALRYLVDHEPGTVLGHLAFGEADRLLAAASQAAAPFLTRWVYPADAERVAEWATRVVLSYSVAPSARTDLCDRASAARLVRTFMLPGVEALSGIDGTPRLLRTPIPKETAI